MGRAHRAQSDEQDAQLAARRRNFHRWFHGSGLYQTGITDPRWAVRINDKMPHWKVMTGKTIGRYVIESRLGEGGMGVVFKARDTQLARTVAVKILPQDQFVDPDASVASFRKPGPPAH